jgi:MFS family permease
MRRGRGRNAHIIRALRHRNYRLFFGGQSISLVGTWMQRIAMLYLVYRLTGSAFLLGAVGFFGQLPTFLVAPYAGVYTDRTNKRRLLLATQAAAMLQAMVLAVLVLTHVVRVWHVLALSIVLGVINAFDMPARQSFMVEMVDDRNDLPNAIALNSSMVNGGRVLGQSSGGILIGAIGEGFCFLLNGLSYIAVIVALLLMRVPAKQSSKRRGNFLNELKEGLRYASASAPIRSIVLLLALVSLVGMPYAILLPVLAIPVLHGNVHTLGFLAASAGAGALCGAAMLASRKNVPGLEKVIPLASAIFGTGLVLVSFSRVVPLSMAFLLVAGFGMMVQMASSNTVLQTIVEDNKRGRVMSLYTMAFVGTAPFGSLLAGSLAERIGAPNTLALGGAACILAAGLFAVRLPKLLREIGPLYERGMPSPVTVRAE